MVDYTHDFEFRLNGCTVEGELTFREGGKFKTEAGEEMSIAQHAVVQQILEILLRIFERFPYVHKITIEEKAA